MPKRDNAVLEEARGTEPQRTASVLTLRTPIRSYAVIWPDRFWVYRPGMRSSRWHTRAGGFYFGDNPMRECNEYVARVALCEQRAKDARTESEKQSWLVMADSWRETVKLQETLKRQAEFIRKVPMPRASGCVYRKPYPY